MDHCSCKTAANVLVGLVVKASTLRVALSHCLSLAKRTNARGLRAAPLPGVLRAVWVGLHEGFFSQTSPLPSCFLSTLTVLVACSASHPSVIQLVNDNLHSLLHLARLPCISKTLPSSV